MESSAPARVLVVAHRTAATPQLLEAVRARAAAGPARFTLLVPRVAHGTSSVLAQRMGLHLADFVVNETGFAADLGAEKFFDLVMPMCGHVPSVAVVIVTLKALRAQGGQGTSDVAAGFGNLRRHLLNIQRWGVPAVVALNRFPGDADADLEAVRAVHLRGNLPQLLLEAELRTIERLDLRRVG